MSSTEDLTEIIPGKFFWTVLKRPDSLRPNVAANSICYSIDEELVSTVP